MKKLLILPAVLSLSALLSACGGEGGTSNPPPTSKFVMTVQITGAATAPVTVTNTTSKATVFSGMLTGNKTFSDLAAGSVLSVQGGAVNGYTTPDVQTVTLDGNKSVTLEYKASSIVGTAWNNTSIAGQVVGTDLQLSNAYLGSFSDDLFGKTTLVNNVVSFDLSALVPGPRELLPDYYGPRSGCIGNNSDPDAQIYGSTNMTVFGPQGDLLGYIDEKIVAGPDSALPQATLNRLYSDRRFTYKGTCTFYDSAGNPYTETVDVNIRRGWNTLVVSQEAKAFNTRNASSDDRIKLAFTSAEPRVVVALGDTNLNFVNSENVTVNAEMIQVGNYSGEISLSTDLPGLTVEPATLTLNPLPKVSAQAAGSRPPHFSALSLRSQRLSAKLTFKYSGNENVYNRFFSLLVKDSGGKQVGQGNGLINVSRPGISVAVYGPELELAPSSTRSFPVSLTAVGNFSGEVTVSLSGLPAGVSAPASKVNLQYFGSTELTLTSGATVKSGTYPLTITAQGGGKSATTTINLVVPKSSVSVSLENSSLAVAQGEKATIGVTVQSRNGFSGSATVQLTGLPNGITSDPTTVVVTPNTTTTVRLPVTAAASATLGETQVTVTSPDLDPQQSSYGNTFTLLVRPARTALGNNLSSILVAGNSGVWTLTSNYNSSTYTTTSTFKHLVDGKVTSTATVNGEINKAYSLSDGSILAYHIYDTKAYVINDTGIQTITSRPSGLAGYYNSNAAVDDQGRLWFTQESASGAMSGYSLMSWNPVTSTLKSYVTTNDLTYFGSYIASNDGKHLVYQSSTSADFKIDTSTGEMSSLGTNISTSPENAALKNDGVIYFTDYYGSSLKRLNLDGTITGFLEFNNINGVIGMDKGNDNYLWVSTYYGVAKINLQTNAMTITKFDSISGKILLTEGGIGVLTTESINGNTGTQAYLTLVR